MRILMLAQFYPPVIGGEERHVRALAQGLAARGHEVVVATTALTEGAASERDGAVRVERLRGTVHRLPRLFSDERRHAPPAPDPEMTRALRRLVGEFRPQVVHAHNWMVHSYVPLKRRDGPPLVLSLHDYSLICAKKRLMYRGQPCHGPALRKCLGCAAEHYGPLKGAVTTLALRLALPVEARCVDLFLPVSRAVAASSRLAEQRLPFEVVPNFVPDDVARVDDPHSDYLSRLPSSPYLLYVGDLSDDKGVNGLLTAYAQLESPPPLVLIGRRTPTLTAPIPPGAVIEESWPHGAVMAARRNALLAVVPSIWPDPCPTTALEAMACGQAVVASATGGLTDIVVDGETGLLVPPADPAALRDALRRLLHDPALREQLGRAGLRRVRSFQAGTVVPRVEAIYRRLCQETGQSSATASREEEWSE
ncbi:MAG: glycosyltransferase family 4 protein [Chloroflexota bacterium]|nr:glycosyltransferase family 4 protein [Dehalococcoidia bacterium]MDW8252955.1 glycosyltransferase family 4 protein [Chloroflexota bacterium]